MQLSLTLSALLSGVLVMLSMQVVESTDLQRSPKLATLPLKRLEQSRDVHPQIHLQQHINRSLRRLARINGNEEPTNWALEQRLERRVVAVDGPRGLRRRRVHRRKKGGKGASAHSSTTLDTVDPTVGVDLGLEIESNGKSNDIAYMATVQMGTPPQNFLLFMDTTSADLWVGSEHCKSKAGGGCGKHNFLGSQSSSSFVDTGKPFSIPYGAGPVSGNIITDNINIGGLALKNHVFGVANSEPVDFSADTIPYDGVMGLAPSAHSSQRTPTPVDSLVSAELITDPIVSFMISRRADNKNDGEITFGGLDPSKFDSNTLVTVPNVSTQSLWEASIDSLTVDGTDTGSTGKTAIFDTGTILITMPPADAIAVHNLIQGAKPDAHGGFTLPCTTTASVAFTFGGQTFTIDPRDIAFEPIDRNNPQGDCFSCIITANVTKNDSEWIVGIAFLKNAYFSLDASKNTISFAKLV